MALGVWLKKRIPLFDRLNIPASIVGGLIFAVVILVLRDRVINFEMDLVKKGGPQVCCSSGSRRWERCCRTCSAW